MSDVCLEILTEESIRDCSHTSAFQGIFGEAEAEAGTEAVQLPISDVVV